VFLQTLSAAGVDTPVRIHGIPQEFLDHAKRAKILERIGLTSQLIALRVIEELAEQPPVSAERSGRS
jgi:1-deoxy-D-xylulose-5-phosphate synthase